MIDIHELTKLFCQIDDFHREFEQHSQQCRLPTQHKKRGPACGLSVPEIMTLMVCFQHMQFRHFKAFYRYVSSVWKDCFPLLPSYQRLIELIKLALLPLVIFIQVHSGRKTGIYYIDSTALPACHIKRSSRHKVFEGLAEYGKTSVGWFFGLKLHLVVNQHAQLIAFRLTRGNKHDASQAEGMLESLKGLAFGDKGYIGKELFEKLIGKGLKLITRKRKNMKDIQLLSTYEKQLLNQRGIIETVIDHLKHHYYIWHTRHRSIINAMTHLVAALAAYSIDPSRAEAVKLIANQKNWVERTPN